ncbi:MAG TPA: hypothetical protein VI547_10530 [Anaerolineales bacterium]|nr:hypothetical protein [Anaerolineales bacterium]
MPDAILWLSDNQQWIYLILLALCIWNMGLFWRAHHRAQFTTFNIERETFAAQRNRALTLVFLFTALMLAVLLSNAFVAPNLTALLGAPPTPTPILPTFTPAPTFTPELILPGLESPTPEIAVGPTASRTPIPAGGSGCLFPGATITSPIPGAILAGAVEIRGTANIENFAYYVVEISTLGDNWLTVVISQPDALQNPQPVVEGVLGVWDTSLQDPGDYALRLVVYDSAGNHPLPCTIPITIQRPAPTATLAFP